MANVIELLPRVRLYRRTAPTGPVLMRDDRPVFTPASLSVEVVEIDSASLVRSGLVKVRVALIVAIFVC